MDKGRLGVFGRLRAIAELGVRVGGYVALRGRVQLSALSLFRFAP